MLSLNKPYYRDGHLYVDLRQQLVKLDGETVTLTPMQYEVLSLMVRHAGEVVPRAAFLRQIWGYRPELNPHRVDMHIHGVRRRLGVYADRYIETVFARRISFPATSSAQRLGAACDVEGGFGAARAISQG